jgi:outer membrane protein TolC
MYWMLLLVAAAPEPLTLKEAISLALANNADIKVAAAQQDGARHAVAETRSRFIPEITVGSGLAATRGIPLSIGGSAPAALNVVGSSAVFNVPFRHTVRQLEALHRASGSGLEARRNDVVYRVASTYVELDKAARGLEVARREAESLKKLEALTAERVQAGVEIPLELTRARLNTAKNHQRAVALETQVATLEAALKTLLALPEDRAIQTVSASLPDTLRAGSDEETKAVARAWENSPELRRLAQEVEAAESRVRAERAEKYPQMDLVAQYALLTRFNNFDDFYRRFERHNVQLGVSFRLPLFAGPRIAARVGQAEAELTEKRQNHEQARRTVALAVRRLFQSVRAGEAAREVARLELDLARENTAVLLARLEEGRASARELEQARLEESARWNVLLESGFELDRARLELLKTTGEIVKVLQ